MTSLDVLEFVAFLVGSLWFLTGAAIWLRWGWCGVRWIWRRRIQLDQAVEGEITVAAAALDATGPVEEYRNG